MQETISLTQPAEVRILVAARALFIKYGFAGVSTGLLAKEAKISKSTLYKCFGDMNGVLEAIVKNEELRIVKGVNTSTKTQEELFFNLSTFGANLLDFLNDPDIAVLDGVLAEHSKSSPGLAERYYELSYGSSVETVSEILSNAKSNCVISFEMTSNELAEILLSAWEGFDFAKARFGISSTPYPSPTTRVKLVLELLLTPLLIKP
jgi:AcrR family transcriptional regulator